MSFIFQETLRRDYNGHVPANVVERHVVEGS
jgi:hypothetical protein